MKLSQIFTKTTKTHPADAESVNARLLVQAGFVHQEMAGVYSWLPLGLRVLNKVEGIIREEMNLLGASEVRMTSLQPKENWLKTGRWDTFDVLFKVPSQTGKEYALGSSHEEIVTPLVGAYVKSYKDLPVAVYQIQTKFRDELRAKSGVLRGREFGMKDLYSFHSSQEDLDAFYARVAKAYMRIFARCGLDVKMVEASGGNFSKKNSHEFQVHTDAGEDMIFTCENCNFGQNTEVATVKEGDVCPICGGVLNLKKGVEVGNIFDLGMKYTVPFELGYTDSAGSRSPVYMGCYGIGTTRLVGSIVEALHDERGMMWPREVAPFAVHLVSLSSRDEEMNARIMSSVMELYENLQSAGYEVLWDDRDASAGEKLADADLIGIPLRILVSEKTLRENSVEWKERGVSEVKLVSVEDILQAIEVFKK